MKCLIIGHTKNIGKSIFNALKNTGHSVTGISRSNGYDLSKNYDEIKDLALEYDLVVNNAYCEDAQLKLLNDLNNKVSYIISIGSISGYYNDIANVKSTYVCNKAELIEANRKLSYTSNSNLLLVNIGLTENASQDFGCSFQDISDTCLFWLEKPNICQIDFSFKLTDCNVKHIENDFDIKLKDFSSKFF